MRERGPACDSAPGLFSLAGDERLIVGGALLAYLAGRRWLEPRVPALLPALLVGLVVAATPPSDTVGWQSPPSGPGSPSSPDWPPSWPGSSRWRSCWPCSAWP